MKILHFITSLKIGGAESALVNFLTYKRRQQPDGVQHTTLYLYHGPNVEKIQNLGISTYQLKGFLHHYDPIAFVRLLLFIKKYKPDVIHTALWSANIIGRLAGWLLGIPVISDLHGSALDEGSFRNRLDALTAPLARKIVAVSSSVQESYQQAVVPMVALKHYQNSVKQKLCVIPNGIEIELVRARSLENPLRRSDFGLNDNDFIIGAVGRLEPIKSYDVLIRAFALLQGQIIKLNPPSTLQYNFEHQDVISNSDPVSKISCKSYTGSRVKYRDDNGSSKAQLQLTIRERPHRLPKLCLIGSGSQEQELKKLAKSLGITDSVNFVGARSDAIKFYPLFDCFTLSSQSEGLSIALLEALCFGLPIVSTHQDRQHDVITHNLNGLLVPVGNEQALADALKALLFDTEKRKAMRNANVQLIRSFDLSNTVHAYEQTYHSFF